MVFPLVALLAGCAASPKPTVKADCDPTPVTLRLASIAPAVGATPVWMTRGGDECWCGERAIKTAWIVDRRHAGALEVTGASLDGGVAVRFPLDSANVHSSFRISDAGRSTAPPGDAPSFELEQYAFHVGYVSYPRPGCYRLSASVGRSQVEIVVDQPECVDCSIDLMTALRAEQ